MKFNNKGMTLIELLITLVFVGIILVFMFSILNDLRNETDNNNFAYNNQVNKVDAIHVIQKDLNTYTLLGVQDVSVNDIRIDFHYLKGTDNKIAVLATSHDTNSDKYYLEYTNVDGEKYTWEMKDAEIDTCAKFTFYKENTDGDFDSYYFKLNINLYNKVYHEQNNKDKNNFVDDIEITYSGYNTDLEYKADYLTSKNGTHDVGKCRY